MDWISNLTLSPSQALVQTLSTCQFTPQLIGVNTNLMLALSVCCREERAEPKGEAFDLPVNLRSYPHLWS